MWPVLLVPCDLTEQTLQPWTMSKTPPVSFEGKYRELRKLHKMLQQVAYNAVKVRVGHEKRLHNEMLHKFPLRF